MKKLSLLCLSFILSCSDISPDGASEAVTASLPKDFEVSAYLAINPDVSASQLALSINDKNTNSVNSDGEVINWTKRQQIADCVNFLSDKEFAKGIYLKLCPEKGWNQSLPCEGQENLLGWNNPTYSAENSCFIKGCWSGGWEEPLTIDECLLEDGSFGCELEPLSDLWDSKVESYSKKLLDSKDSALVLICQFNLIQMDGVPDVEKDKEYINNFKTDTVLAGKHFLIAGIFEGRPYRYCSADDYGEVRSKDLAKAKGTAGSGGGVFYDYSANLFCLKQEDGKVYKIK